MDLEPQDAPALRVIGLAKKFPGQLALDGVSFEARRGEVVCIVGPNGAGKTTLLYLAAGLLRPSAGHVSVFGLHRWRQNFEIRKRSTVLPATPVVGASPTPYEYLRFIAQIYGLPKKRFLERLSTLAAEMQFSPYLERPWNKLSLGLTKKAGLIACFLPDAELRILDEPFAGGIDPFGMTTLYDWFGEAKARGELILFSTQVLEQAQHASDRILLLQDGSIRAQGPPAELIAAAGIDPAAPHALARAFIKLAGNGQGNIRP